MRYQRSPWRPRCVRGLYPVCRGRPSPYKSPVRRPVYISFNRHSPLLVASGFYPGTGDGTVHDQGVYRLAPLLIADG